MRCLDEQKKGNQTELYLTDNKPRFLLCLPESSEFSLMVKCNNIFRQVCCTSKCTLCFLDLGFCFCLFCSSYIGDSNILGARQ